MIYVNPLFKQAWYRQHQAKARLLPGNASPPGSPGGNPLFQQPWYNQDQQGKKEEPKLQKNCDLCGDPLGEKFYVGLTHPEIKLGAITCDKRKCYKWLHEDHRKRHTRIIE